MAYYCKKSLDVGLERVAEVAGALADVADVGPVGLAHQFHREGVCEFLGDVEVEGVLGLGFGGGGLGGGLGVVEGWFFGVEGGLDLGFVGWGWVRFEVGVDLRVTVGWFDVAVSRGVVVLTIGILIEVLVGRTVIADKLITVGG